MGFMPHSYAESLVALRLPALPRITLTMSADAAKPIATITCKKIGRYSFMSLNQPGCDWVTQTAAGAGAGGGVVWSVASCFGMPLYFLPSFFTMPRATRF